ncbi:MAG TPA: GAF domain-containing sensor histidine kinase [Nocardioidaceae bacterium]|nr:GAF domain-containing sensor histidine kinase [Nocardioidaceae bacterium]
MSAITTAFGLLDRQRLSISSRAVLLTLTFGLTLVESMHSATDALGVADEVTRHAALVIVAIVAIVAASARPKHPAVPVAEAASAALVMMVDGGPHESLLPYLLAPALDAGLLAGVRGAVFVAGSASAMVLVARLAATTRRDLVDYSAVSAEWILLALLAGVLAAWARRLGVRTAGPHEPYPAAYRLVSQLRTVSRHLSGGLDAVSLARMLMEQMRERTDYDRAAVFVPGPAGRLVPLASDGHAPDWDNNLGGDGVMAEAWSHQRAVLAPVGLNGTTGLVSMALPLTVGARTIGMLAAERRARWEFDDPAPFATLIEEASLRIETALLFGEVRAIATAEERKRLAREIHDGVAQELAFMGYMLDDLAARSDQEDVRAELTDLRGQVTRVVGDLRLSIFELRTDVHHGAGLGSVLSDFVRSVGAASPMTVHLALDESTQRLPQETEAELLRIAQESVNNARKHSAAENLWVTCSVHPPQARLVVEDDGRGMMQEARGDSFGLQIMRERADRMGATLSIDERPGGGTRVEIMLGEPTRTRGSSEQGVSEGTW